MPCFLFQLKYILVIVILYILCAVKKYHDALNQEGRNVSEIIIIAKSPGFNECGH